MKDFPQPASLSKAMRRAILEARRWLGATHPNPPVGAAALDTSGRVLKIAAHTHVGSAHAEAALIETCRQKGMLENVAAICVSLEPCNHTGRTPPCTQAILRASIRNIAIGMKDPNPDVIGGGADFLRSNGINVTEGVEEGLCKQLIYAFDYSVKTKKPWVTVKRAFDENGSMIPPKGKSTFTSDSSLLLAHRLRKRSDAILTGSGTVLSDSPSFTVRHVQDHAEKKRFLAILDRRKRIAENYLAKARHNGLTPVIYDDIAQSYNDLFKRGVREILVEAGPELSQSIIDSGLWNMLVDIRRAGNGHPDIIETSLNSQCYLPFDANNWQLENMLPYEG